MTEAVKNATFPEGQHFLNVVQEFADKVSKETTDFTADAGKKLPVTMTRLGNLLSKLYQISCCAWGCSQGDHVLEWLTGRVVNQAMSAYRLTWAANYDEALTIIRGIGEAANLAVLFRLDSAELASWKTASRSERLNQFAPAVVRQKLEKKLTSRYIPIDKERYQKLCEIGTHPVPGMMPGHFNEIGISIVGGTLQGVGVCVCINELAYAVSLFALPVARLISLSKNDEDYIRAESYSVLKDGIGGLTILNYEEKLKEGRSKRSALETQS